MYEILKNVILAGGYKLAEIQHKVKKLYAMGDLAEEQMDELLALAAAGVSTDAERPEVLEILRRLAARVDALEERLNTGSGTTDGSASCGAWTPWDGVSDQYRQGTIVTHNGQLWQSVYGGQNVWEPGAPGTESLWKAYSGEVKNGDE